MAIHQITIDLDNKEQAHSIANESQKAALYWDELYQMAEAGSHLEAVAKTQKSVWQQLNKQASEAVELLGGLDDGNNF